MTTVGIITQARTTSTRLPRKVLLEAAGETMLAHHLERLSVSGLPVFVATTTNAADEEIVDIAVSKSVSYYRGSESDVLSRFHECASVNTLDVVVRVTADCPLIDGKLISAAVTDFLQADDTMLYLSNTLKRTFPRGFDFEVFSASALADAHAHATELPQREHVTPYLYAETGGRMHVRNIAWKDNKSGYRVTLDTADDLTLIRSLIEDFDAHQMSCAEIIALLDENHELAAISRHLEKKKLRQ